MKNLPHAYVCIMAGGSGERFWPMSRRRAPKHLLKLLSNRTLIEETVRRVEGVVESSHIFVLTNEAQLEATRTALQDVLPPEQIIAEPAKRDTAPAAALATALVRSRDPKAVLAVLPADSFIRDQATYERQLRASLERAGQTSALITFAITPSHASTGFGYLQLGAAVDRSSPFRTVARFVEKPNAATAAAYVASGEYAWNAGMFVWSVDAFLAETSRHAPALAKFIREFPPTGIVDYISAHFPTLEPRVSVDYAIMEKAASVETIVAEFDWDDVGLWTALPPHLKADDQGNSSRGAVVSVAGASNNIAVSNGRMIALVGVKDLIVVETADGLLVCHRDRVADIKQLMPHLPPELL